ncbi:MAG: hypothetical protein KI788_12580, partial [Mameliella sp.]|nr:hypothetical protein [Mameliella sp.]
PTSQTMTEMDFRRACANQKAWGADESATSDIYWQQKFVNWKTDQWGETVEVITNDMTGEGCEYSVPKGAARSKRVPVSQVQYGYFSLLEAADPGLRLDRLPY